MRVELVGVEPKAAGRTLVRCRNTGYAGLVADLFTAVPELTEKVST